MESLSWKDQLGQVRRQVQEHEKQRELEKKLLREKSEQSIRERLEQDTAEALTERFAAMREQFDHGVRKFYPLPDIEAVEAGLSELKELLQFFANCMKEYPKVFTPEHKTAIPKLMREITELNKGMIRQLEQWRALKPTVEHTVFRARQDADNTPLVDVAKDFSERAHNTPLSVPGDYFGNENENFWVAECDGVILGYVKYFPEDKVVTFALRPAEKANFNKFVRGLLHKFHTTVSLGEAPTAVRVHITYLKEVKFFTDLGFTRSEIRGPSDWMYERELN